MDLPTRLCNAYELSMYSDSWDDAEVKAQCEAYTARVRSGPKTYRNRHCVLCNIFDVPQPCHKPTKGWIWRILCTAIFSAA
jgi:hypothetical protein